METRRHYNGNRTSNPAREERQNLVLSFSELNELNDSNDQDYYFTAQEAFFGDSLLQFVADECHAMLNGMFCHVSILSSFYNPLYSLLFAVLYVLSLPGAFLHWILFDLVPVRAKENPEERELRSKGIYLALGLSLISIPFDGAGLYLGDSLMQAINMVSLAVNCAMILFNLLGLKALGGEYFHTMRTYIVGVWIIVVAITGLALFDVYYFSYTWLSWLTYVLRLLAILVYFIICLNVSTFWNVYEHAESRGDCADVSFTLTQSLMLLVIAGGLGYAIFFISEENAWQVLF